MTTCGRYTTPGVRRIARPVLSALRLVDRPAR